MTTTAQPKLRTGTRMSLDDFLGLGETDGCWELDEGVLYIMPTASRDHQFLQNQLVWYFVSYLDRFPQPPAEMYSDLTTILSRELQQAPEPDIVIVLAGRPDIFGATHIEGVPDIVVEILSTDRRRDLVRKRHIYAAAGVKEYWIVDPRNDTVLPLELRGREYAERPALGVDDILTTPLLPGLAIPLADLFRHRRRPARAE